MNEQGTLGYVGDAQRHQNPPTGNHLELDRDQAGPLVNLMGRRETHSSRSFATVLLALALIVILVWCGTELVRAALGLPPLVLSGEKAFSAFFSAPELLSGPLGITLGALLSLAGLFLIFLACAPGSLNRHRARTGRFAFIVDDRLLASALSAAIRKRTGLTRDQVVTRVSARRVLITVTPTSGHRVDTQELTDMAQATIDSYALTPAPQARVQIEKQGVISHG